MKFRTNNYFLFSGSPTIPTYSTKFFINKSLKFSIFFNLNQRVQSVGELGHPFGELRKPCHSLKWYYFQKVVMLPKWLNSVRKLDPPIRQLEPPSWRNKASACCIILMYRDEVVQIVRKGGSNCPTRHFL